MTRARSSKGAGCTVGYEFNETAAGEEPRTELLILMATRRGQNSEVPGKKTQLHGIITTVQATLPTVLVYERDLSANCNLSFIGISGSRINEISNESFFCRACVQGQLVLGLYMPRVVDQFL